MIRRKLRCKAISTAQKNVVVCMRFPCVHALADCVPVCDQRSSLVRDFFLLVAGHSIRATFRVCIRFLDFRVRRFDNKLQVAFDRVRCWFVEVLLTSQLGR